MDASKSSSSSAAPSSAPSQTNMDTSALLSPSPIAAIHPAPLEPLSPEALSSPSTSPPTKKRKMIQELRAMMGDSAPRELLSPTPTSPSTSSPSSPPTITGPQDSESKSILDHAATLAMILERTAKLEAAPSSTNSNTDTRVSLASQYNAMTKKKGKKTFQRPCAGAAKCKNVLCNHVYAPVGALTRDTSLNFTVDANIDSRVLKMLMDKSEKDGFLVSFEYATKMLQKNQYKLVPALKAIKDDIISRETKLHNTGRVNIPYEHATMDACLYTKASPGSCARHQASKSTDPVSSSSSAPLYHVPNPIHHPSLPPSTRDTMITMLESEDKNLAECLTHGWNSLYGQIILDNRSRTKADREYAFGVYRAEAQFRVDRQTMWDELGEENATEEEREECMRDWEEENRPPSFVGGGMGDAGEVKRAFRDSPWMPKADVDAANQNAGPSPRIVAQSRSYHHPRATVVNDAQAKNAKLAPIQEDDDDDEYNVSDGDGDGDSIIAVNGDAEEVAIPTEPQIIQDLVNKISDLGLKSSDSLDDDRVSVLNGVRLAELLDELFKMICHVGEKITDEDTRRAVKKAWTAIDFTGGLLSRAIDLAIIQYRGLMEGALCGKLGRAIQLAVLLDGAFASLDLENYVLDPEAKGGRVADKKLQGMMKECLELSLKVCAWPTDMSREGINILRLQLGAQPLSEQMEMKYIRLACSDPPFSTMDLTNAKIYSQIIVAAGKIDDLMVSFGQDARKMAKPKVVSGGKP
ncbi:hypothetical protein VTL71DRAFT_13081 [Oculimacula yallundae]|uniref:Uncharacterized protein n=1 Tax=Oculimacula yallundae TaxID=86028 RepID=A0ABR4CPE3_9HELO